MRNSRIEYFDIAKGIAIISVIIGHLGISIVNHVVFTYHLPVFLFISGYFINQKHSLKDFSRKKFRSLMIPYFITCIVIVLLGTARSLIKGNAFQETIKWITASLYGTGNTIKTPFYIPQIGAIWYLPATCAGTILLRWILEIKEQVRPFIICILFAVGYLTSKYIFWFPMSVQAGLCSTFFMYMGWMYKKNELIINKLNIETKITMIIIAVITWIMFIFQFEGFYIVSNSYGRGIVDLIGAVFASILIILISKCIEDKSNTIKKILLFAGKYSLLILCIHIVEYDLFPVEKAIRRFVGISDQTMRVMIIFFKPTIILFATWILLKIRIVRKVFGYET